MSKLVIIKDDAVLNEIQLDERKLVIGRDAESDITLSDQSVSRHHAAVSRVFNEYFVEDFGSTNGTLLNDKAVTKHILKNGDVLQIGNFEVRFESEAEEVVASEEDLERTVVLRPKKKPEVAAEDKAVSPKVATLHFVRGPFKGDSKVIDRSLYTIGQPGGEVAAIARRPQGFYLLPITSSSHPKINNIEIEGGSGVQLSEGDVVEVGDNLAEISFKA
jgi:predicted component of type VI protein secretion system